MIIARNLAPVHDAATVYVGVPWRMPTNDEFMALFDNCEISWTTFNGVKGLRVSGRGAFSTRNIFLPAAGFADGNYWRNVGSDCRYWSSTPKLGNSYHAMNMVYTDSLYRSDSSMRQYGLTVRPVRSPK